MQVLSVVANSDAQFYKYQQAKLAARGIETTTLSVPGKNTKESVLSDANETRSVVDYVRFVPDVLRHSFGEYDLIHANFGLTTPAAIAQPNLPVVVSLWGTDLYGPYGWVTKSSLAFVDEIIVMSEQMAADLDRDCHVIPHGVDLDLFSPEPQSNAQDALGWSQEKKHVLFPYPPRREVKNYPRAKRVVDQARARVDGSIELHTLSGIAHDEMSQYMNAADVLLLTSNREGSPNTVKEALACNLPVVATNVGDVAERLDGVSYSRVGQSEAELVDGLCRALAADERSNGRQAAAAVSLDAMAEEICAVFESALDSHTTTGGLSRFLPHTGASRSP
ncbi:MAG: glycosyltransferase family 4 protein [Halorientalis sp.]